MSETIYGVTIKLARVRGEFWRMGKTKINCFGRVIGLSDTQARHQILSVKKTVELNTEKAFVETSFCAIVLIYVHDTSNLKLKLPGSCYQGRGRQDPGSPRPWRIRLCTRIHGGGRGHP
jgi:hypothetical protein